MKLCSKERHGGKVVKKYELAQTTYQRLVNSSYKSEKKMTMLMAQYKNLDPVKLLKELQSKQEEFWKYAWIKTTKVLSQHNTNNGTLGLSAIKEDVKKDENNSLIAGINVNEALVSLEYYKHSKKHRKPLGLRTWRTRKDPFESVSQFLSTQLAINPGTTAKDFLNSLM